MRIIMSNENNSNQETNVDDDGKKSSDEMDNKHVSSSKSQTGFCSSFKSKRYRDKLRSEIKCLESLLPVDRSGLHRKLDSQTVFRLVISFFRTKFLFKESCPAQPTDDPVAITTDKPSESENGNGNIEDFPRGDNALQALDGFLLLALTDGTILYVSDSVLQYLGFNQVDLMHRCLYSILHPDDHYDVKQVMEQNVPGQYMTSHTQKSAARRNGDPSTNVSILCRMRSFCGTSVSYLKMHCSGRIRCISSLPKTPKSSNQIVHLFCRPFMSSGQDAECDVKQSIFWSKHDLDLTFKQLDKKAKDVIGYVTDDVDGESFYKMIHPEDITTCCVCHKALIETSSIQTMYFRVRSKNDGWVWLHSRSKVVTKNSKKYSIVFSHSPVREEDSGYIQQEILLRQRYSINELFYLRQNNYHLDNPSPSDTMFEVIDQQETLKKTGHRTSKPSCSLTHIDSFVPSLGVCPSSWHASSGRHSPVLPSTHVAHKISLREKQIHFQDFKKRRFSQQMYGKEDDFRLPHKSDHRQGVQMEQPALLPSKRHVVTQQPPSYYRHSVPPGSHLFPDCPTNSQCESVNDQCTLDYALHSLNPPCFYKRSVDPQANTALSFGMPPSPPPSPHQSSHHHPCMGQDRTVRVRNVFTHHPTGGYTWVQDQTYHVRDHSQYAEPFHSGPGFCNTDDTNVLGPSPAKLRRPSRQISFSKSQRSPLTECLSYHTGPHKLPVPIDNCALELTWQHRPLDGNIPDQGEINHCLVTDIQSCAVASGCCEPGDKLPVCLDPAYHMRIVEENSELSLKTDIDLPSIGSFLEYLNDI